MSPSERPRSPLQEAIHRFKSTAKDLKAGPGDIRSRIRSLKDQLRDAHLRLGTALDALSFGAAVVSSFGTILLANDAYSLLGLGQAGQPLPTPLREFVESHAGKETEELQELNWTHESREFMASLVSAGAPEDSFLLLVQEEGSSPEEPLRAALEQEE